MNYKKSLNLHKDLGYLMYKCASQFLFEICYEFIESTMT